MSISDEQDAVVAEALASSAGEVLLELRPSGADPAVLRSAGDRAAQDFIATQLAALRPADVVRSEEAADDPARSAARRVWIVDPLDGTTEYGEAGRADWAVHVALWQDGELAAGAVALPALGRCYGSGDPPPLPPAPPGRIRIAVSRNRPPQAARRLGATLNAELVPMGSAGAKAMAVLRGEVHAYLHAGGQYEWDSAAPVAVARAAGLHTSRLDGGPLRYNQPDPWLPDLLICRDELAGPIVSELAAGAA